MLHLKEMWLWLPPNSLQVCLVVQVVHHHLAVQPLVALVVEGRMIHQMTSGKASWLNSLSLVQELCS